MFGELRSVADPGGILSKVAESGSENEFLSVPDVAACVWSCSRGIEKTPLASLCLLARDFVRGGGVFEASEKTTIPGTGIELTERDANPYSVFDAHPDNRSDGVGVGWGSIPKAGWLETYAKAFEILKVSDPGFFAETDRYLKKIVPLGTDDKAHRSCSYAEAFGCVYMGLVPNEPHPELSVLEGLIHEWSHNKANLSRNLARLVLNGREEDYYSPYRPDPRPIEGIFLGAHAFVPTVRVFLRAFEVGAIQPETRIAKTFSLHLKNRGAVSVLEKHLRLSHEGAEYWQETFATHLENEAWLSSYRERFPGKYEDALRTSEMHSARSLSDFPDIHR